jgi:hypothetical protein
MSLKIEVKDMKKPKKEESKTLAVFKVTLTVDDKPIITLPNFRIYETKEGQKVNGSIHERRTKKAKEGQEKGETDFIKCYYPFKELNDLVLVEAQTAYAKMVAEQAGK